MKVREANSKTDRRAPTVPNGRHARATINWKDRIQRPRISDPAKRQKTLKQAGSRIKTDVRVDLGRERRG